MSAPALDPSLDRTHGAVGIADPPRKPGMERPGYDLSFGLPAEAATPELQTLSQGCLLLGRIAARMGWDWPTLVRNVEHVSAPLGDHLMIEVGSRLFRSPQFRAALATGVPGSGLDPYKVKFVDAENANAYILGHGLPPL